MAAYLIISCPSTSMSKVSMCDEQYTAQPRCTCVVHHIDTGCSLNKCLLCLPCQGYVNWTFCFLCSISKREFTPARPCLLRPLSTPKMSLNASYRWTSMWQRFKILQETVWQQSSRRDLLVELCKALLAAGEWKLARSYLTGTGSTPIPPAQAEEIVISAARDHFYSASSLDATEIQQAQLSADNKLKIVACC